MKDTPFQFRMRANKGEEKDPLTSIYQFFSSYFSTLGNQILGGLHIREVLYSFPPTHTHTFNLLILCF